MSPAISAIIFDCDGVLVDSEVLALEIELAALAQAGLTYEIAEYKARFMGTSSAAFYAALEEDCLARNGRSLPSDFRETCKAQWRRAAHRLAEVPGAAKAVAPLTCTKAVASSSTREALAEKLRATGLWSFFAPHVYSADHVTHAKPAPDLFLYASGALGVSPETCLVLEDSANGVKAARAAGMTVWGFTGGAHMDPAMADSLLAAGADRLVPDWATASELFSAL